MGRNKIPVVAFSEISRAVSIKLDKNIDTHHLCDAYIAMCEYIQQKLLNEQTVSIDNFGTFYIKKDEENKDIVCFELSPSVVEILKIRR